ncbi:MAG: DUF3800 domain-containing protein [Candidatus Acidiferrum sp.]
MAVLQAFFDESGKQSDHPLIAVCCVCAPLAKIENFNDNWNRLLRKYGVPDFHMVRASKYLRRWGNVPEQKLDERIESLRPFADCIVDNLELGLVEAWDVKGFKAIPSQLRMKIGNVQDPYYLAFVRALMELADYPQGDDVLSLICDYDIETAWESYRHYQGVRRVDEKVRKKTVSISFADDKFFPALQAADLVAFLTRCEARNQFYGIHNEWLPLFSYLVSDRGISKMQWKKMFADEVKSKNCLRPTKK